MTILIKPHLTEKTISTTTNSGFTFEVLPHATKTQIKNAVEVTFGVNVTRVNTRLSHIPAHYNPSRRTRTNENIAKYATVYLKKGQSIDLFEFKDNSTNAKEE